MSSHFVSRVCCLILTLFLTSCASTDIKNIEQGMSFHPQQDEKRLWNRAREQNEILLKSGFVYEDERLRVYVNEVLHKLIKEYEKGDNVSLEVYILKDPSFNAFCYPDGTIYLHTSILANLDNEAQLATVLAHETIHFLHRHILKNFRSMINKTTFLSTLNVLLRGSPSGLANLIIITGVEGSIFGYQRTIEREADRDGFELVYKAGYDVNETKKALEGLYNATKGQKPKIPYFYQSHPQIKDRIKTYQRLIKKYHRENPESKGITNEEKYREMTQNIILDNAEMDLMRNNVKLARQQIEKYNRIYPENHRAYYLLGEVFILEDKKTQAQEAFRKSIELNPGYAPSHKALGMLAYKQDDKEEAEKEFSRYLRLNPQAEDEAYIRRYLDE